MGLGYPGGPALEKLAKKGDERAFSLPRPLIGHDNCNFSFSGLKTALIRLSRKLEPVDQITKINIAASYQKAIIECLVDRTKNSITLSKKMHPDLTIKNLVASGGVAANKKIRAMLMKLCEEKNYQSIFPPIEFCGDNAAMIAMVGLEKFKLKLFSDLDHPAKPRWPLDEDAAFLKGAGVRL